MGIRKSNPSKNFLNRNLTIYLDQSQVNEMKKFPEVNWSIVARIAFKKYCESRVTRKRTDTEEFILAEGNRIEKELENEQKDKHEVLANAMDEDNG